MLKKSICSHFPPFRENWVRVHGYVWLWRMFIVVYDVRSIGSFGRKSFLLAHRHTNNVVSVRFVLHFSQFWLCAFRLRFLVGLRMNKLRPNAEIDWIIFYSANVHVERWQFGPAPNAKIINIARQMKRDGFAIKCGRKTTALTGTEWRKASSFRHWVCFSSENDWTKSYNGPKNSRHTCRRWSGKKSENAGGKRVQWMKQEWLMKFDANEPKKTCFYRDDINTIPFRVESGGQRHTWQNQAECAQVCDICYILFRSVVSFVVHKNQLLPTTNSTQIYGAHGNIKRYFENNRNCIIAGSHTASPCQSNGLTKAKWADIRSKLVN